MNLIFLVEELSMEAFLNELLPKVLPDTIVPKVISHEGKSDLEKSIPIKLKGWNVPDTRFIIMRDKDHHNCKKLKANLVSLCPEKHRSKATVRIVCHELESWLLGDLQAVALAYQIPQIAKLGNQKKYRKPDSLSNPSEELFKLITNKSKVLRARQIAKFVNHKNNRSKSFQVFMKTITQFSG